MFMTDIIQQQIFLKTFFLTEVSISVTQNQHYSFCYSNKSEDYFQLRQ